MLRNRVYLGEVFYRDQWHRAHAHHPPLVSAELFDEAEQVLIARGDDHTHRTGARFPHPTGLIFCTWCGKRYQGTTARGSRYTYRSYTCFTRQHYGTTSCAAERLPADQVEHSVIDSMLTTPARRSACPPAREPTTNGGGRRRTGSYIVGSVPPAGFEPALPPPEGWGARDRQAALTSGSVRLLWLEGWAWVRPGNANRGAPVVVAVASPRPLRRLSVSTPGYFPSLVGWVAVGPGSDLSEESAVGVGPAALDCRVAPGCPPGPAATFASRSSVR